MQRRSFLGLSAGLFATGVNAQAPSARPMRLVVGFPAGGSVDSLARLTAEILATNLGRPVVVENKPGAGGRLAVEFVRNAAPDGETLLVSPQGPMTLFPHIFRNLRFDPARDFTGVTRISVSDLAFSAGPMVPAGDISGLRAWLKTAGDRASFGSGGAGTVLHFAGVAISDLLGVKMAHVPYQGSPKSLIDLAGGTIPTVISPLTDALELHKAGRVRILATLGRVRSPFVPDVPTLAESGFDIDVQAWNAIYGPARLPSSIVEGIRASVEKAFATSESRQRLAALGVNAAPLGPEGLEMLRRRESAMWERAVRASGFTPET